MSEPGRKPTPPVVLIVVTVLAAGVGWFAIERLAGIAERTTGAGAVPHSWHLIALQALILAILCLVGISLWLIRRRDEAVAAQGGLLAVLDAAPDGMALLDGSCRVVLVNSRAEALFGYHRNELLGRPIEVLLPDAPRFLGGRTEADTESEAASVLRSNPGALRSLATKGRRKDGGSIPLEISLGVVTRREGALAACVFHDVSDKIREEARLREAYRAQRFANDRLRGVVEGTSDMIAALDRDGRYILLNSAYRATFERLFSRPVEQGMRLEEALEGRSDDLARLKERWARALAGEQFKDMAIYPDGDGALTHLEVSFSPIRDDRGGLIGAGQLIRDVTDRVESHEALRRNAAQLEALGASREQAYEALQNAYDELKLAESRLVQAEKLSALGQLIAGVAHEINNPLAFVGNDLAILQRDVAGLIGLIRLYQQAGPTLAERHPELSVKIAEAAEEMDLEYALEHLEGLTARARAGLGRIRRIVKDLRDFARLDEGEMDEADLGAGLVSTVEIVSGLARDHDVAIVTDLAPLPAVACSPGKINQVVLNLIINAVDASRPGGKVTLRARPDGSDGVAIDVIDEGVGIPPEIRGRIFDPFFTTKPVGKGTGLGLSISYGIIQDHGGRIEVDSTPGRGSRFTIHLPLKPPPREAGPRYPAEPLRDGR